MTGRPLPPKTSLGPPRSPRNNDHREDTDNPGRDDTDNPGSERNRGSTRGRRRRGSGSKSKRGKRRGSGSKIGKRRRSKQHQSQVQPSDEDCTQPRRTDPCSSPINSINTINIDGHHTTDAFLSHSWSIHSQVIHLSQRLTQAGVQPWLDDDHMKGDMVHAMTNGIDNTGVVLVCITRDYIQKCASPHNNNCKLELDYAYRRKGGHKLLPLIFEADCLDTRTWNGKVGAYLGSMLYIDCTTPETCTDNVGRIVTAVQTVQQTANRPSSIVLSARVIVQWMKAVCTSQLRTQHRIRPVV